MLVLGRHRDEAVHIGSNVIIRVMEIRGDKVRLGIEAPGEIPVHRSEVVARILAEGRTITAVGPIAPNTPEEMVG